MGRIANQNYVTHTRQNFTFQQIKVVAKVTTSVSGDANGIFRNPSNSDLTYHIIYKVERFCQNRNCFFSACYICSDYRFFLQSTHESQILRATFRIDYRFFWRSISYFYCTAYLAELSPRTALNHKRLRSFTPLQFRSAVC